MALVEAAAALWFLTSRSALTSFPLDDSWIHLVYARSFAHLRGFSFNDTQEAGSTSPLWVMLAAPLFWLEPLWSGVVVAGVKALGLLLGWLGAVLAWRLAERLTGSRVAAFSAGLLFALEPSLVFSRLSGMEVTLTCAVTLFSLLSLAEGAVLATGVGLALLPIARPETMVLWLPLAALLIAQLIDLPENLPGEPALWTAALAPSALTLGGWAVFCLATTGHPLPNTFYAKHLAADTFFGETSLRSLWQMLRGLPMMRLGGGFVLLATGALALIRNQKGGRLLSWLVVLYLPAFMLALAHTHALLQPAPYYWHRYFEPAIPTLCVVAGAGAGWLSGRGRAGRSILGLVALAVAVAVALGTFEWGRRYARNCRDLREMNVTVAGWLQEHTGPDDWIASSDAGAVRFLSGRRTVDLLGLNDAEMLFGDRRRELARARPRFFVTFPPLAGQLVAEQAKLVFSATASDYSICDCPGQHQLAVYQGFSEAPPR